MIGLDTNILLRYLMKDDPEQFKRAKEIMRKEISEQNRGFISTVVLVETCWTLRNFYKIGREGIETMLDRFLVSPELEFEHREEIWKALRLSRNGSIDFVDGLIGVISEGHGCEYTLTFDRKAAKNRFFKAA